MVYRLRRCRPGPRPDSAVHPVLTVVEVAGIQRPIGTYGALISVAVLLGSVVTVRATARAGLDAGAMISALALAVGLGFVGAYAGFVAVNWVQRPGWDASLLQPGVVFYAGAATGALGLAAGARWFGLSIARTLDLALPGLPLAHAIGRLGCWFGGCCYGAPCDHGFCVTYTDPLAAAAHPSVPRHPWPLYEAACLLVLAGLFASPTRFASRPGQRAAGYVLLYALLRMGLEPLRGDAVRGVFCEGAWSTAQLTAAVTGSIAVWWLWRQRRRDPRLCARAWQV